MWSMKEVTRYQNILSDLWFSDNESLVYVTVYRFSNSSISTLSRLTQLSRSTLYWVVHGLIAKWYLNQHVKEKATVYSAISYEELKRSIESKKALYEKQLTEFEAHRDDFEELLLVGGSHPLITYYTASEVRTRMYDKILEADVVYSIRDIDATMNFYQFSYEQTAAIPRQAKRLTQRIVYDTEYGRRYVNEHKRDWYELRLCSDEALEWSDIMIIDGTIYHGRYDVNHTGVAICDPVYYKQQVLMFEALWSSLDE